MSRLRTAATCGRIVTTYAAFAIMKRIVSIQTLVRWAWSEHRMSAAAQADEASALAVTWLGQIRRISPAGDCLHSALVIYRELSRAGAAPHLVGGFARGGQNVVGHAWVELDGVPVGETEGDLARFTPALRFGVRGRPLDPETGEAFSARPQQPAEP